MQRLHMTKIYYCMDCMTAQQDKRPCQCRVQTGGDPSYPRPDSCLYSDGKTNWLTAREFHQKHPDADLNKAFYGKDGKQ